MADTRSTIRLTSTRVGGGTSGAAVVEVDVPRKIGPVELVRQVGVGGMGVVWLGRHEILARDVAVKFLFVPAGVTGEDALNVFVQGARAAAAVRHPGLTGVHDAGVVGGDGGMPFVIMEYVDGPTLADVLRRGPLALPAARAVLAQVCAAVGELHAHDLVHRDIKPSNIMIDRRGTVLVTDFGLACPRAVRGRSGAEEEGSGVAGTPGYMSPEMYGGEVTAKSDVYAIGATAFEMLGGRMAVVGDSFEEIRSAAGRELPREVLLSRGAPEGVVRVIERCMNKEAVYRPRSAGRVGELFEEAFEKGKPRVMAAGADAVRDLAFPQAGTPDGRAPEAVPDRPAVAGTMQGLVSTLAEAKRKSDARMAGERERDAAETVVERTGAVVPDAPPIQSPRRTPASAQLPPPASPIEPHAPAKIPVRWGWLVLAALIGVAGAVVAPLVAILAGLSPSLVGLGAGPPGVRGFLILGAGGALFGAAALWPAALTYRVLALRRAGGKSGPMCGWCGYALAGLVGDRCPECGRNAGDHGRRGDRPPGRRWERRLMVGAMSVGALWAAFPAALVAVLVVGMLLVSGFMEKGTEGWMLCLVLGASMAVGYVAALWVYHMAARGTAMLDGVVRCGRCGATGESLRGGRCAECEPAERPRAESRETTDTRPGRRFSGDRRIPWRTVWICAGIFAIIFPALTYPARLLHSPGYYACVLGDRLGVLDATTTPYGIGVDGIGFKGLPPAWLDISAVVVMRLLPTALVALLMLAIYHKLAFSRPAGVPGLFCGWCGYNLSGVAAERCPECGRSSGDRGRRGDRPPARRFLPRARATALTLVVLFAAMMFTYYAVALFVQSKGLSRAAEKAGFVLMALLVALPTCAIGLAVYHLAARSFARLDGRVRCGLCGAVHARAGAGECSSCEAATAGPAARPPAQADAARPRTPEVFPVPWWTLGAIAALGAAALTGTRLVQWKVVDIYVLTYRICELLGLLDTRRSKLIVNNVEFPGQAPVAVVSTIEFILRWLPFVIEGFVLVWVYHRFVFRRGGGRRGVACGWCGYNLSGIILRCCPECGRGFEDEGRRGDRPPARRVGTRLRVALFSVGAFVGTLWFIAMGSGLGAKAVGADDWPLPAQIVGMWLIVALPTCVVGLLVYHVAARPTALLDGVTRCARCGAKGERVRGGRCAVCEGRAGAAVR